MTTSYETIREATANFTKPVGIKVGKSRRYTRYLQPGMWDLTGKLMLRSRRTDRHIESVDYANQSAIEALVGDGQLCAY